MAPLRVGLIGLGAIGQSVCKLAAERAPDEMEIVGALVRDAGRARPSWAPPIVGSAQELLGLRPDVVAEAGGHAALAAHGPAVLRGGVDLLMVSIGALADPAVEQEILEAARAGRARARVLSGAIGALDAIAAAAEGNLERVTHITTKPAHTLMEPSEASRLDGAIEVFRGTAREAALRYPESVNVMAAVSLAGLGMDRTEVRVVADPAATRNQHVVEAEGDFGWLRFEIRNVPSEENPRTGKLTAMSVFQALHARTRPLGVG